MRYLIIFFCCFPFVVSANVLLLDDALRATYTACVGIDDELAHLKKMAGINTAITSVGTAAGVGATLTGLVKADKDKQLDELIAKLAKIEDGHAAPTVAQKQYFLTEFHDSYSVDINSDSKIQKLTKQSKKLGNWRTGLMASTTATNVAGAIIAGTNKVDTDLKTQINNCIVSIETLRNSITQARINGIDVSEAESIASACGEYEYVDVSKINNRARGATISSTVGAATGLAGTVTSAMANTDKTRNDNTESDKQKEKNLNTASNVLAGATTVASATATVFNATQINAIKKVAAVAEKCTGVLK